MLALLRAQVAHARQQQSAMMRRAPKGVEDPTKEHKFWDTQVIT